MHTGLHAHSPMYTCMPTCTHQYTTIIFFFSGSLQLLIYVIYLVIYLSILSICIYLLMHQYENFTNKLYSFEVCHVLAILIDHQLHSIIDEQFYCHESDIKIDQISPL